MISFQILTMIPKIVYYWRRSISDIAPDEHFFPTNFLLKYIELKGFSILEILRTKKCAEKTRQQQEKNTKSI